MPVGEGPLSSYKAENVQATYAGKYDDVVVKSFENGKQINDKEAPSDVMRTGFNHNPTMRVGAN